MNIQKKKITKLIVNTVSLYNCHGGNVSTQEIIAPSCAVVGFFLFC